MSKVSYKSLLKDALSEFDTSDTVDVKGPMLDPILSWEGEGELPTNKDAASILERYYFNEDRDDGVSILDEMGYENDKGEIGDSKAMKHTEGPGGEEQAGTADAKTIQGAEKEKEKDIAKEDVELEGEEISEQDEEKEDEKEKEVDESLELEDAIIEKLIGEMEGEEISEQDEEKEDEKEDEEEVKEEEVKEEVKEEGENFHGGDAEDAMEEDINQLNLEADIILAEEAEAKSSMQDAQGAGTQQAGTGDAEGEIPNRKDREDQMTKAADVPQDDKISDSVQLALDELESGILEQDEEEAAGDEEEKDLDVDKEMKKEQAPPPAPSAYVGGPSPKKGEDAEEDAYEESFRLFEEAIEEELEDVNTDDVKV